jgi:hypothetical protein
MISIFPLWTFHLFLATFQHHLHKEHISLSWYDILGLVVPIRIYLIKGRCQQGSYWTKGSSWLSWSHHYESFAVATMTWFTVMEYLCLKRPRICSTCRKHLRSFPHSWLITGVVTRLTRQVPLVEQELLTLPEFLGSLPVFCEARVTRSLVFMCMYHRSLFILLYFFFWPLCCLSPSAYGFW